MNQILADDPAASAAVADVKAIFARVRAASAQLLGACDSADETCAAESAFVAVPSAENARAIVQAMARRYQGAAVRDAVANMLPEMEVAMLAKSAGVFIVACGVVAGSFRSQAAEVEASDLARVALSRGTYRPDEQEATDLRRRVELTEHAETAGRAGQWREAHRLLSAAVNETL